MLEMILGESSDEKVNSSFFSTGSSWHDSLTCLKCVPRVLLKFHFPSEGIKKFLASIAKIPDNINSDVFAFMLSSLGTNMSPLMSL